MDQYDKEQAEEEEESSTSIKNTSMMHHDEEAFIFKAQFDTDLLFDNQYEF